MARAISVGIEISLDAGNYAGLEKTLNFFAGNEQDVSVLVFSPAENPLKPEVIAFFPADLDAEKILADSASFFRVAQPFQSSSFSGTVEVYVAERVISALVWDLNYPVYILLVVAFLVTALLFYFVALRVSRPVAEITGFAQSLIEPGFSQEIGDHSENEIGILKKSLVSLRDSLNAQKLVNQKLLDGLETEVKLRTDELRSVLEKLRQAQLSAKLGNFVYWFFDDRFETSENLNEILGSINISSLHQFLDLLSDSGKIQVKPLFKNSDRPGHRFSIDVRLQDEVTWINLTGLVRHDERTGELFIGGTIQDITDRKSAEAEVHKLSLVAKLSTNGIIITDRSQRILWANQSAERLTGYTLSELIGKSPRMFQFEGTDPLTVDKIKASLWRKEKVRVEILNRSKTGRIYWVELHIEPFFNENGSLDGYLAIEVDITERKRYETELKAALEKEKEVSQLKSRIITMTSHEFRTPLTTIQSNAELLQFHIMKLLPDPQDKSYRFIGRINKEVTRLTNLMNDILLLGRIDSGKLEFRPVSVDLTEFISELISQQKFVSNDERTISLRFHGHPKSVKIDLALFNHVLSNIFSNALKYSPGAEQPICDIDFQDNYALISVTDFGIGIPAEDLSEIFESFHRGKNAEHIQGTGLGLQIVKQFVEMHGGEIFVNSKEGAGTTVTIRIPV